MASVAAMIHTEFSHVRTWVFDLDNTLYPPSSRLFDLIEPRITAFMQKALGVSAGEADILRHEYWRDHGTTLAGLMDNHGIEPGAYLRDVHDISMDSLTPDPLLVDHINALPGRKIVYTNGTEPYARNVLAGRGLDQAFDAVYGIEHADFKPKPRRIAFEKVFAEDGLDPAQAAMFEDDPRNLEAPHAMGMRTVHVADTAIPQPFIHHHTDDLTAFLGHLRPDP